MATKSRAYPYPVLRSWIDDYQSTTFVFENIAVVDSTNDLSLEFELKLDNDYLNELIIDGSATVAIEVKCPETLYRSWTQLQSFHGKLGFGKRELFGAVTVEAFVVSERNRPDFQPWPISEEYGSTFFEIAQGDPLAITEEYAFDLSLDLKGQADSLIVRKSEDLSDFEYLIDLDASAIAIITGSKAHSYYQVMKSDGATQPHIFQSMYKDAVLFAILEIASNPEAIEKRWGRGLAKKLAELGIAIPKDIKVDEANKIALGLVGVDGFGKVTQNVK